MPNRIILFAITWLLIILSSNSCSSQNESQIKQIDNAKFTEIIYCIWIDDNGNVLDTVSIDSIKRYSNGALMYSFEDKSYENVTNTIEKYYRADEDLFISKVIYEDEDIKIKTDFITFLNADNNISRAIMKAYEGEEPIVTTMNYSRTFYQKGKKKQLRINASTKDDSISDITLDLFINFDKREKPINEFRILNKDTTERTLYTYKQGILRKKVTVSYKSDDYSTKVVRIYNSNEYEINTKTYSIINGLESLVEERKSSYNENDTKISEYITDIKNNEVTIYKYIKRKLK